MSRMGAAFLRFGAGAERLFSRNKGAVFWLLALCVLGHLLYCAWVTEDAYITFRTIDHFLQGYGLRWNVDERVQAYTHPLWMMLNLVAMALTREEFYTSIALGLACSMAAYLLLARQFRDQPLVLLCTVSLPLLLSYTWNVYGTSGLENPLSHLLVVLFALEFLKEAPPRWGRLSLITALAVLNRMDLALIFVSPLLLLLLLNRRNIAWRRIALGALPLLLWLGFSFLYYGSIFPNTYYAKLSTGIAKLDLIRQGLRYAGDFLQNDSPSALILLAAVFTAYFFSLRSLLQRRLRALLPLKLGTLGDSIVLYTLYTIYVGGDFMSGRFFSVCILLAVIILAVAACNLVPQRHRHLFLFDLAMLVILGAVYCSSLKDISRVHPHGIANEWSFYKKTNRLLVNLLQKSALLSHPWVRWGHEAREGKQGEVAVYSNAGMTPYFAGPGVRVVDPYALAEPLLARLPLPDRQHWRVGHYFRSLPVGYLGARRTGNLSFMAPTLQHYYGALRHIITGDVFDSQRILLSLHFLLGRYDSFIDEYERQEMRRTEWPLSFLAHVKHIDPATISHAHLLADAHNVIIKEGVEYRFTAAPPVHATYLDIGLREHTKVEISLLSGGKVIWRTTADTPLQHRFFDEDAENAAPLVRRHRIALPPEVAESPIDLVHVQLAEGAAEKGAPPYMLFHLVLE